MDIRKVQALRGPNIWAAFPVLEVWLEVGPLLDLPSEQRSNLAERLREWLPFVVEARAADDSPRRGFDLPACFAQLVLELLGQTGTEVRFSRACDAAERGVCKVAIEYHYEDLGRAAVAAAHDLCRAAIDGRPIDVPGEVEKLRALAVSLRLKPLEAAVTQAARERRIPARRLGECGLLMLGQGAQQRRLLGARTDRTGAIAEAIAGTPELAARLLRAAGLPVSEEVAPEMPVWRLLVVGARVVAAIRRDRPEVVACEIHPDLAANAVEAASIIGLDVAAVVVAADDLTQPPSKNGILAIEADPSFVEGTNDAALTAFAQAITAELFPDGQDGRIPVVAVTGVNGKTTTIRLIAHILTRARLRVGMTCTEGIYIGRHCVETGDCSGPRSAQTVLQHPAVDAAVLETARGGILRAGLGFDFCDVGVVTNIGEGDHLGASDIETVEQLARVKRTVVEAVRPGGAAVLKADDPLVAGMASACRGEVIYFSREAGHPLLRSHLASGGRAVIVRDERIVLAEGPRETSLVALDQVPLTGGGRIGFQVENVLASVATAWSLGIHPEAIITGLETFRSDLCHTPARFNLIEVNRAVAVLDYGHNVSSLAAVLETLEQLPHARRTAVYSAAGDRRDADLIRQGELLGDAFDRVILYEDGNCSRGREQGEIIRLFREGLAEGSRVRKIQDVQGAVHAVDTALNAARPGELLLLQVDIVEDTLELVRGYLGGAAREISIDEAVTILARSREAPLALVETAPG